MASDKTSLIFDIVKGNDTLTPALQATQKLVSGVMAGLGSTLGLAFAGLSFSHIIDEASKAEEALNNMNIALASSGNYSKQASEDMAAFANSLQQTTRYSDEAVLGVASYIENLTKLDTEGLKRATKSSLDLASALGMDVQSAAMLVSKAIEGNVGALRRYGIAVKVGADEQTRLNNVVQALSGFSGQAEAKTKTYAGSMDQLKNAFSDNLEVIGLSIIQNKEGIKTINDMAKTLFSMVEPLKVLTRNFMLFGTTVGNIFQIIIETVLGSFSRAIDFLIMKPLNLAIRGINLLGKALNLNLEIPENNFFDAFANANFDAVKDDLNDIGSAFKNIGQKAENTIKNMKPLKILTEYDLKITGVKKQFEDLKDAANDLGSQEGFLGLQRKMEDLQDKLKEVDLKKMDPKAFQEQLKGFAREIEDVGIKAEKARLSFPKLVDGFVGGLIVGFKNTDLSQAWTSFKSDFKKGLTDPDNIKAIGEVMLAITSGISQGAEGARKLIVQGLTKGAEAVGMALAGPLGAEVGKALGPIFDLLSQGPEKTKEMIQSFIRAIPNIVKNIALAIPALFQALIDELPILIYALIDSIPLIIDGIIQQLPRLFSSFISMMPTMIPQIVVHFVNAIPSIVDAFINGMVQGAPKFVEALIKSIGNLGGSLGDILGGGGGGGGIGGIIGKGVGAVGNVISSVGDIFGFAKGGSPTLKGVPDGYLNDSFPASLQSGELVVDYSTANKLKSFLDGNQNGISNGLLNQILNVVSQPITVNTSVELNRKAFADIILDLNRSNARLA